MTKRVRNDVHSPKNLIPENYEFVGVRLFNDEVPDDREFIMEHMKRTGGKFSTHDHGGFCDVCGNPNVLNYAVFYHKPTNTYIKTGLECADTISTFASAALNDAIQEVNRKKYLKTRQKKAEARRNLIKEEFLKSLEGTVLEPYASLLDTPPSTNESYEQATLRNILVNGTRYGSLTERQWAYAERLVKSIEASGSPVQEPKTPLTEVVEGKYEITGKIISIKYKNIEETPYPGYRRVVEDAEGRKYYGSAPAALLESVETVESLIGREVVLSASVNRSFNNPYFGFFKRPKLVKINK
jgi:hypothetical protein